MKKKLLCCIFLVSGQWSAVMGQPVSGSAGQQVENLANVDFKSDIRLFTVMAALNVAGFNHETAGKEISAVRKAVREELRQIDPLMQARLKSFYVEHSAGKQEAEEQVAYTSLALLLSGPPEFELQVDRQDMPSDAWRVLGFEKLVREFYQAANIPYLWRRYQRRYADELGAYRPVLKEVVQETLKYFRTPPRIVLDRQIIFIPDLLNAHGIVNARNLQQVYYVVAGPTDSAASNHAQLQHEYLHFLIDPLVEKFSAGMLQDHELLKLAQSQPHIKSEHQNKYGVIISESLIESMMLRLHPAENAERELVRLFRQGLIFVPHFYRSLQLYEKSELVSFPLYSETLLRQFSEETIREDEKQIAALQARMKAEQTEAAAEYNRQQQETQRLHRIQLLLNEAGQLISTKQYGTAQQKLTELLAEDPNNGSTLFYLAQIAAQQKEHSRAFEYYRRAAHAPSTPHWVRAWSVLRMGNFLASQDEVESALVHFQQVLAMNGDLHGAREEAQRLMQLLPSQKR